MHTQIRWSIKTWNNENVKVTNQAMIGFLLSLGNRRNDMEMGTMSVIWILTNSAGKVYMYFLMNNSSILAAIKNVWNEETSYNHCPAIRMDNKGTLSLSLSLSNPVIIYPCWERSGVP